MSATGADVSSGPELSPEAQAFVRAIGSATDLPAFVRNVRAIAGVASDLRARVALLEQAIVKDVALTGKVLRIASSAMHGNGGSITSVKQAIMLLGYDRVQHLSTAASVFEQLEHNAPAVQDLLVQSVLTANQSLCLAVEMGYERPELAYLCGLFRGLGEVLVACYRSRQYAEWVTSVLEGASGADGAEARVFGFTFDEVGMALARQWGMPSELVATMCRVSPSSGLASDRLHHLTQFSADLTRSAYGSAARGPSGPAATDELMQTYTRTLGVDREAIQDAMSMARLEARPTLDAMQVSVDVWVEQRASRAVEVRAAPSEAAQQAELAALAARCAPVDTDTPSEAHVRAAVRAVTEQRLGGEAPTVGGATSATLEAVRGAGYERALLGLSTDDFKMVRGRMGAGPGHDELVRTFLVRPAAAFGPLGAALQQRQALFVDLEADEGKPFRRDRLIRDVRARSFAVLPLVLEGKLLGCLYFDSTTGRVEVTETLRELLCAMRDHLESAFARHRQEGGSESAA